MGVRRLRYCDRCTVLPDAAVSCRSAFLRARTGSMARQMEGGATRVARRGAVQRRRGPQRAEGTPAPFVTHWQPAGSRPGPYSHAKVTAQRLPRIRQLAAAPAAAASRAEFAS